MIPDRTSGIAAGLLCKESLTGASSPAVILMPSRSYLAIGILLGLCLTGLLPAMAQVMPWWSPVPDVPCMQAAIRARDEGFIANFNTYNAAITNGLQVRMAAEAQAWTLTDPYQRQQAIYAAGQTFSNTYGAASYQLYLSKEQTRYNFALATRTCQMVPPSSSSSSNCPGVMCTMEMPPPGCYRTQPSIVNGCQIDCGIILCPYPPVSSSSPHSNSSSSFSWPSSPSASHSSFSWPSSRSSSSYSSYSWPSSYSSSSHSSFSWPSSWGASSSHSSYSWPSSWSSSSSYSSSLACGSHGTCRDGQTCPSGTYCSYMPAYGCYPAGCPYPI